MFMKIFEVNGIMRNVLYHCYNVRIFMVILRYSIYIHILNFVIPALAFPSLNNHRHKQTNAQTCKDTTSNMQNFARQICKIGNMQNSTNMVKFSRCSKKRFLAVKLVNFRRTNDEVSADFFRFRLSGFACSEWIKGRFYEKYREWDFEVCR